jgi:membrane associated rhomboid family serine protease
VICGSLFFLLFILLAIFLISFVFPLPVSDGGKTTRYKTIPWATFLLIIINVGVFMAWLAPKLYVQAGYEGSSLEGQVFALYPYIEAVWTYGFRKTYLQEGASIGAFVTFTSMFMHADFWHLFGNMAYLWTFGHRLEDACGPWRFLGFYLVSGMIANMGSALLNPSSADVPGIGASGAIAGVMGAYLLLFFDTRILSLWGIGSLVRLPYAIFAGKNVPLWRWTIPIPAWVLLIFFGLQNTLLAVEVIREGQTGGVNYLAHYAGFVAGLLVFLFVRKDLVNRYLSGRSL